MISTNRTEGVAGAIVLTVTVDKEDLQDYLREVEKRFANELRMDGFRPGKIPREVLIAKVGEARIREEALEYTVQNSFIEIISQERLDVADHFDLAVVENTSERLVYKISVILYPDVTLGTYKGLCIERMPVHVSDDEVNKVIENLLQSRVKITLVNRPARLEDRVEVDFTVTDNGTVIEGGHSENHPLILGRGSFVPGFEEAIIGMIVGEQKDFELTMPSDYHEVSIRGKKLAFHVFLKQVAERVIPKLTDEFVAILGKTFKTVADVRVNIHAGLTLEGEAKERDRVRLDLLNQVIKASGIIAPPRLIERQLDSMLRDLRQDLAGKGLNLDQYLEHLKKTEADLRAEWHERAQQQVKLNAVVRAIAKAEKLSVDESDVDEQLQLTLERYVHNQAKGEYKALKDVDADGLRSRIADGLVVEKVFEFIEQHAHGIETPINNFSSSTT